MYDDGAHFHDLIERIGTNEVRRTSSKRSSKTKWAGHQTLASFLQYVDTLALLFHRARARHTVSAVTNPRIIRFL